VSEVVGLETTVISYIIILNDGTPSGLDGRQSKGNERRNEIRPRTLERRNAGQYGNQPRKDGCQDRLQ
jgi:hypothetical protein